jgi:hypothetical protein
LTAIGNFDLTLNVTPSAAAAPLSREQIHEMASWFKDNESTLPEGIRFILSLLLSFLAGSGELRLRVNELGRELRRALGITRSSERRRSGEPLAVVSRAAARSATDERQRLEAQRDRSDRLSKWHDRLADQHLEKAKSSEEKLTKMKKKPKSDPMIEPEHQGPSAQELELHEQMPVEQIELSQEQEAKVEANAKVFVEHLELGDGASDSELQPSEEALMPAGAAVSTEQNERVPADLSKQPADMKIVKTLQDDRVRYDIAVQVSRIELGVEKQVVVNGDGQRTVVSASTDSYGPPRFSVTWSALGTLAVLVGQFAIPLNRLATLFSSAGKDFTAGGLSRMLHYVAIRLVAIYIELGEQLSDADILAGDDTKCRVLEVNAYFEQLKAARQKGYKPKPPWSGYRTPLEAQQSLEECERQREAREQRRAEGHRDSKGTPNGEPSLGILIGRHLDFESQRRDGKGAKQSMNTTVVTGRSVAKDPRSLIVFYRSHLGGHGDLLESILRNRKRSAKELIVQGDLSPTNLIKEPDLLSRFSFKLVGCSAHARRPFALHEDEDPMYCSYMLHLFTGLSMHEERLDAHGRNRLNVLAVRQHESRRLWEQILEIATKLEARWSKESKLGAGARYIINHYDKLTAYLDDPRLQPTNNMRERMLRTEKLIENSSMFRRSLEGRFVLDIVRTILQTAVAARVPVHKYLVSVLRADPDEIAKHPERFTPYAWAARQTAEQVSV